MVVKYILRELMTVTDEVKPIYVSLRNFDIKTSYKLWKEILRSQDVRVPLRGVSSQEILWSVKRLFSSLKEKLVIIVLDEVDYMEVPELSQVLYVLRRGNLGKDISLITISVLTDFYSKLDGAAKSTFSPRMIHFPRYNVNQLVEIVRYIASLSLDLSNVDEEVFSYIASKAYRERGGDCRYAIDLLRVGAELAQGMGVRFTVDVLPDAEKMLEEEALGKLMVDLSVHHKILLASILYNMYRGIYPVRITKLYDTYTSLVRRTSFTPLSYTTIKQYLREMEDVGIVVRESRRGKETKGGLTTYVTTTQPGLTSMSFPSSSILLTRSLTSLSSNPLSTSFLTSQSSSTSPFARSSITWISSLLEPFR
mgnify:CR=1 FL=1